MLSHFIGGLLTTMIRWEVLMWGYAWLELVVL